MMQLAEEAAALYVKTVSNPIKITLELNADSIDGHSLPANVAAQSHPNFGEFVSLDELIANLRGASSGDITDMTFLNSAPTPENDPNLGGGYLITPTQMLAFGLPYTGIAGVIGYDSNLFAASSDNYIKAVSAAEIGHALVRYTETGFPTAFNLGLFDETGARTLNTTTGINRFSSDGGETFIGDINNSLGDPTDWTPETAESGSIGVVYPGNAPPVLAWNDLQVLDALGLNLYDEFVPRLDKQIDSCGNNFSHAWNNADEQRDMNTSGLLDRSWNENGQDGRFGGSAHQWNPDPQHMMASA